MRGSHKAMPFIAILLFAAIACGSEDPTVRTADWEENFNLVNQASASGDHERAIGVAEAFLKSIRTTLTVT